MNIVAGDDFSVHFTLSDDGSGWLTRSTKNEPKTQKKYFWGRSMVNKGQNIEAHITDELSIGMRKNNK